MGSTEKYEIWKRKVKDRKLFKELLEMDDSEINSAFYKELEFGTAGIRGIMGPGTKRLNIYTVRKITQGVVLRMKELNMRKVVISYDSRINSELFAKEAACVFAASDISAVITYELMPSPFLSYATRKLGADMGIMITASHNSKEYNGYKVYDKTGCQIRDDEAKEIASKISKVDAFRLRVHKFDYYVKKGMISYTTESLCNDYLSDVEKVSFGRADGLKVVYTPLCGTGYRMVPAVLTQIGCEVIPVESQNEPSGKFATCPFPNPEKREALRCGMKTLRTANADVLIATDPDADRIGVAYWNGDEIAVLNGNEIGVLMCDYLLSHNKSKRTQIVVRTIVSTDLADKIAADYGAEVVKVPTGFKYIGEVINKLEDREKEFLLGFEESQGYLTGTLVRDKDAVVASKVIAQMVCEFKEQGMTPGDKLLSLYEKYGYYSNEQFTYSFEGEEGDLKMKQMMTDLRENPLATIGDKAVTSRIDYSQPVDGLPPLNMIYYEFDEGRVIIRPSGTEPLIKVYALVHAGKDENSELLGTIKRQFEKLFL